MLQDVASDKSGCPCPPSWLTLRYGGYTASCIAKRRVTIQFRYFLIKAAAQRSVLFPVQQRGLGRALGWLA